MGACLQMNLMIEAHNIELYAEGCLNGDFESEHGESFFDGKFFIEVQLIALEEVFGSEWLLRVRKRVLIIGKGQVACALWLVLEDVGEMRKHVDFDIAS